VNTNREFKRGLEPYRGVRGREPILDHTTVAHFLPVGGLVFLPGDTADGQGVHGT
jgi:hypothetical protein